MTEYILTQEYLKEILHYNSSIGSFTWLINATSIKRIGDKAGTISKFSGKKYLHIRINKKTYKAHRLAFLYMTGEFPSKQVDHIDGNGLNNKFNNLRNSSQSENCRNRRLMSNNKTGVCGVNWAKTYKKWRASIYIGKRIELGHFNNFSDAVKVRKEAELKYGFHKNHGSIRPL